MTSATPDGRAIITQALRKIDELSARLEDAEKVHTEPIAVVGMGCRFPADVVGPESFWRLLVNGVDGITEVPADRWDADEFYDPDPMAPDRMNSKWGGFVSDVAGFDADFFGISPWEAAAMDPQQRILLEVTWEALEHAGIAPDSLGGSRTGVMIGLGSWDYTVVNIEQRAEIDAYMGTGILHSTAVGRISYLLGLQGPAVAVDTACSSSLVALHLACQSLRLGESDLALAGGVQLSLTPVGSVMLSKLQALSPRGRCSTFDAGADGFVRGEGAGVVVLKRLSDAVRDGDRVLAVVRGSAVNQDGRSNGLTAPNLLAQRDVITDALRAGAVAPDTVNYVEAHGTGTALGDPIEFEALAATYGRGEVPCALGAVKTNLGHLEAAAGIAGLIKAVLVLERGQIPPNLHFTRWNPAIDASATRLFVPTETVPWPEGAAGPRRAGVSSFGISGTNAHVVLEQAPDPVSVAAEAVGEPAPAVTTLVISGKADARIASMAAVLAEWLAGDGSDVALADVAHTLNHHRTRYKKFATVCARDRDAAVAGLRALAAGVPADGVVAAHEGVCGSGTVFVYSGQGSHWAGMGRQLLADEPVFAAAVAELEPVFVEQVGFSLRQVLADGEPVSGDARVQPVLVGLQLALTELWRSCGVTPDAVIGHSVGEVSAAVVSGALTVAEGLRVVATRSRLMARLGGQGAVALLNLDAEATQALIADYPGVELAVYSSPGQTVIAGPVDAVDAVIAVVQGQNRFARRVNMEVASHTALMDPILDELGSALADLAPKKPAIRFISTVVAEPAEGDIGFGAHPLFDAAYWVANVRQPVRLRQAIAAAGAGHATFVEVSPHPQAIQPISETLNAEGVHHHAVGTLRRDGDDTVSFHTSVNATHTVKPPSFAHPPEPHPVLPTTPWHHTHHWVAEGGERLRLGGARAATGVIPAEWYSELAWPVKALPITEDFTAEGSWLVVADPGVGEAFGAVLGDTRVLKPSALASTDPAELAEALAAVSHVIYAPDVSSSDRFDAESGYGLFNTARRLVAVLAHMAEAPRLFLVTRNGQPISDREPANPAHAVLWGLGRTLALEHPEFWGEVIDVDETLPAGDVANLLLAEASHGDGEDQVVYRSGLRHVPRLQRRNVPAEPAGGIEMDGSHLVIGATGYVGPQVIKQLADMGAATIVAVSRNPGSRLDELAQSLAEAGTTLVTVAADVCDEAAMTALFERFGADLPPLGGIYLAAAGGNPVSVADMTDDDVNAVFGPKLDAVALLHRLSLGTSVRQFVLFSSISGLLGSRWGGPYAATTTFLDTFAHARRAAGLPATAINWGLWKSRADNQTELETQVMLESGMVPMPDAVAVKALRVLTGPEGPVSSTVVAADWPLLATVYRTRAPLHIVDDLLVTDEDGKSSSLPRTAFREDLRACEPAGRRDLVGDHVSTVVAAVMGLASPQLLDRSAGFFQAGMDSLMSVTLQRALSESLGQRLPASVVFDYPSVQALTDYLATILPELTEVDHKSVYIYEDRDALIQKIDELSVRLDAAEKGYVEPIAVVGMGCRFPGGVNNPDEYWQFLQDGASGIVRVPADRWDADTFYSEDFSVPGTICTRLGGFLTSWQPDEFDAEFFGISPREAEAMDPQQRLLLEVTWEALENAGITAQGIRGTQTAVYVGVTASDYTLIFPPLRAEDIDPYLVFGNAPNFAAGRLSYFLGVHGPALTIDTACSSSLVSIHLACESLRRRESDSAVAAGVNLILSPEGSIATSAGGMLAPDGQCKTFDAGADGYVRSEGCGAVVLKRLSDAVRDGDPVLAVVRGSGVNQDGPSSAQTVPNGPAQQALLRQVLAASRLAPSEIDYIEAHGTATALGDPIELDALSQVFGERNGSAPLVLGSVKTNFGHLESAAGVAGFIKAVLSVGHGHIPKHLNFERLTSHAGEGASRFTIATEAMDWPQVDRPRRAGVSSFGVSGTNAHIVVEQAPEREPLVRPSVVESDPAVWEPEPAVSTLVVSGKSEARIASMAEMLAEWMDGEGAEVGLADVAHTVNHHRTRYKKFATVCARDRDQAVAGLRALAAGVPADGVVSAHEGVCGSSTVFVYSGQGSHWAGMGRQLLADEPMFAAAVADLEPVFVEQVGFSLRQILADGEPVSGDARVQPVLVGLQLALTELWRSYGVTPDAVIGHSVGEVTAAVVSGALTVAEGLRVVATRSRLMARLGGQGAVALLNVDAGAAEAIIADYPGVELAVYSSPGQTVIAGPVDAVDAVIAVVQQQNRFARRVNMEVASHTALMDPILDELASALADLAPKTPTIRFISTVVEDTQPVLDADYWVANVRQPVRLRQAITAAGAEHATFVEVSPHPQAIQAIDETLDAEGVHHHSIGTLSRDGDDTVSFHTNLNATHTVDAPQFPHPPEPHPVLPPTPWLHGHYWMGVSPEERFGGARAQGGVIPAEWYCEIAWPVKALPATRTTDEGSWLVVAEAGGEAIGAVFGDARVLAPSELAAGEPEMLAEVLAGVSHVLYAPQVSSNGFDAESGYGLFNAARRLVAALAQMAEAPRLFLLTRNGQPISDRDPVNPGCAVLWGLGRTLALEHPEFWGGVIDVDDSLPAEDSARHVLAEALGGDGEDQVVYRAGLRHVPRLQQRTLPQEPAEIEMDGSHLVIGATGNLGPHLIEQLAEMGAGTIVAVSRNPGSRLDKLAESLAEAGTSLVTVAADVCDEAAMTALFERFGADLPPLGGVYLAAVGGGPVMLRDMTDDDVNVMFGPKLDAVALLHKLSLGTPVRQFVLFSSISGVLGSRWSAHYAATTTFLDTFAYARRAAGLPATAINWGLWKSRTHQQSELENQVMRESGMVPMPDEVAIRALRVLIGPESPVRSAIVAADWPLVATAFRTRAPLHIVDDLLLAEDDGRHSSSLPRTAFREALRACESTRRRDVLGDHVHTVVAAVMGLESAQLLEGSAGFFQAGMDSLMSVTLQRKLSESLGQRLPASVVFDYPTVEALADYLATILPELVEVADPRSVARREVAERDYAEPIAVVGMACRFPGGVDNPDEYWQLLRDGGSGIVRVPADRWDADAFYSEDPSVPGTICTREGGFLTSWQPDEFDAEFFGIAPREAAAMDPQQRLLLEVTWEALENAGITAQGIRGTQTAVYVGVTANDYALTFGKTLRREDIDPYLTFGNTPNFAAGRLSYFLGVHGPALIVDSACSSSLVAIHLACESLRRRESDNAVAAGVNLLLSPENSIAFSVGGMLAPDGQCKTFDAGADGYVRGEGCGVVVLKRLSDAVRDGDPVLAVVRGSAVNQDGPSSGQTVPNGPAQQALLRQALGASGLAPSDIDYIEAHGTGTSLGDPIELDALSQVFDDRDGSAPLVLGSAKTNFGHLESAAGVAGFIKAVLSVGHGHIPRHLNFQRLTPRAGEGASRFTIAAEAMDWPQVDRARRAGVSSFGVSGTNAHVVVEQAPDRQPVVCEPEPAVTTLVVSGKSEARMASMAAALADWMDADGAEVALPDVAHTVNHHRTRYRKFATVCARDRAAAVAGLRALAGGFPADGVVSAHEGVCGSGTVFVYSGQGSQWAGMGRQLLADEPMFAAAVAELEPVFVEQVGFSLRQVLAEGQPVSGDARVQPVLVGLQLALTELWRSYGVEPDAVIGHSVGEVSAAVVSGALTVAEGLRVVATRSRLMARLAGQGAVGLLELDAEATAELIAGYSGVELAVYSSPRQTVIAGPVDAVDAVIAVVQGQHRFARRVNMEVASHTALMDPILAELAAGLADLAPKTPAIRFISTVVEDAHPLLDADYWVANVRQPVRLRQAIATAGAGHATFVEVSPHPQLTYAISETLDSEGVHHHSVGTLARDGDDTVSFHTSLNATHTVEPPPIAHPPEPHPVLPATPWHHGHHWITGSLTAPVAGHPLLGVGGITDPTNGSRVWGRTLGPDVLWLGDHRVDDECVLPAGAYAELALAAVSEAYGSDSPWTIRQLSLVEAMPLGDETVVVTRLSGDLSSPRVEIRSAGDRGWTLHATASVEPAVGPVPEPLEFDVAGAVVVDPADLYGRLAEAGRELGPALRGIVGLSVAQSGAVRAEVRLPSTAKKESRQLLAHPVMLEIALQTLGASTVIADRDVVPTRVGRVHIHEDVTAAVAAVGVVQKTSSPERFVGRVMLTGADGRVLADLDEVELVARAAPVRHELEDQLFGLAWEPVELDRPAGEVGSVLLVAERDEFAGVLTSGLSGHRGRVEVVSGADEAGLRAALTRKDVSWEAIVVLCPPRSADEARSEGERVGLAQSRTLRVAGIVKTLSQVGTRDSPRLWLVTRGAAQVVDGDGVSWAQTSLRGLARVLIFEHPELKTTVVDVDAEGAESVDALVTELSAGADHDEVALRGARRFVNRLVRVPLPDGGVLPVEARRTMVDLAGGEAVRLQAGAPGGLGLHAVRRVAPGAGEVEVRVAAAGVNAGDVGKAAGEVGPLGSECVGYVSACAAGVDSVAVGDRVIALGTGTLGSYVTTSADLVVPVPDGLSDAEAAGLAVAYLAAWHGLCEVGRLAPGDRVLIHSAGSGVGLAAVAVAKRVGARIYATAGSAGERELLAGLGLEYLGDSGGGQWADEIPAATDDHGVDVVLNSLSGDAVGRGLDILAPGGRFVELGQSDVYGDAQLGSVLRAKRASFAVVDLDVSLRAHPQRVGGLLRQLVGHVGDGELQRLPVTEFGLADAGDAFGLMAAGGHAGNVVISIPAEGTVEAVAAPPSQPLVRGDGGYIVVGGMGGLGLVVARWLAGQGAGMVVLNGRSDPSAEVNAAIAQMTAAGTRVEVVTGDIAEPDTAVRLVAAVQDAGLRPAGVLHSAMVLADEVVFKMSASAAARVFAPKVAGGWWLHRATADLDLDWWLTFSSSSSMLGSPGQGAYAAANSGVDGLVAYRRSLGLPAIGINWGPWAEVGRGQSFADRGFAMITPQRGLTAMQMVLASDRANTGVFTLDARQWFQSFPAVAGSSLFVTLGESKIERARSDGRIRAELDAAQPVERPGILAAALATEIQAVRRSSDPLDHDQPMDSLGLDSLMALELRNRLEAALGITLPAALVWAYPTIAAMGEAVCERMGYEARTQSESSLSEEEIELLADLVETSELAAELGAANS